MGSLESDTTERLHFHFSLSCIGEGNGNPLQYSCLENPRDGGAWWAAVYGVAQSQTQLKRRSSSSSNLKETEQLYGYPEERWPRGMTPAVWRITDHLFLADGLSDLTRHGVYYRFSSAQARESKSKPEVVVLKTTTLCPHSTVRRAWLTEPHGPAVVSAGHQRCTVL